MITRIALAIAAVFLAIGPASAQSSGGHRQVPLGYCYSSTVSSAKKLSAFTCSIVGGGTIAATLPLIQYAAVCVYGSGIVWRDDGVAPTSTPGSGGAGVPASSCFSYNGTFSALQFIDQTSGATVGLTLYR